MEAAVIPLAFAARPGTRRPRDESSATSRSPKRLEDTRGETINDPEALYQRTGTSGGLAPRNLFILRRDDSECDGTSREVNRVQLPRKSH